MVVSGTAVAFYLGCPVCMQVFVLLYILICVAVCIMNGEANKPQMFFGDEDSDTSEEPPGEGPTEVALDVSKA